MNNSQSISVLFGIIVGIISLTTALLLGVSDAEKLLTAGIISIFSSTLLFAIITENLFEGAKETLLRHGVAANSIHRLDVPGSFELVYGAKLAQQRNVDAVIAIGSVIQGETRHFDFVCEGVTQGIQQLNLAGTVPVIFCVLTDNTLQQAKDRSGGALGNKGTEAAVAALKMAKLRAQNTRK